MPDTVRIPRQAFASLFAMQTAQESAAPAAIADAMTISVQRRGVFETGELNMLQSPERDVGVAFVLRTNVLMLIHSHIQISNCSCSGITVMTFTQLEIFALVAELGGFTAAADKLGISQSAVSHALKQLEGEWGLTLLSRGKSSIEVTDVGKSLLVRVRELLGVSEAIHQEVSAVRGLNRGMLRIGSFGLSSSLLLLPRILGQYRKRYPEIEIFVEEGANDVVVQWISERRVDVGFVVLPDERFDTQVLLDDQFAAVVPTGHALARQRSVTLPELCRSPFIMATAGSHAEIESLFESAGVRPRVTHRCSQIITILKMVESGAGISIVSGLVLSDQVMAMCPGVVRKPLSPAARRSIGLAVPSLKHASPAVHAFLKTSKVVMSGFRQN